MAAIIGRAMRTDPAERYQSADEMLDDLEHVLRTVFQPVGQTELKRWLAQLSAQDGIPSIGRAPERQTGARTGGTGSGELDGNELVLLDSQDIDEEVDGEEATSLAVVGAGGGGRPRISRARSANALPVPEDAEAALEGRGSPMELALPVPEGEEPPDRRRARRGGGFFKIAVFGLVLIGGAWAAGKYARLWSEEKTEDSGAAAGAGTSATAVAAPKPVTAQIGGPGEKRAAARGDKLAAAPGDRLAAAPGDKLAAAPGDKLADKKEQDKQSDASGASPARPPRAREPRPATRRVRRRRAGRVRASAKERPRTAP